MTTILVVQAILLVGNIGVLAGNIALAVHLYRNDKLEEARHQERMRHLNRYFDRPEN